MRRSVILFILLFLAQLAVWNYLNLMPYVIVVFLPAMFLCLPVQHNPIRSMLLAFVLGLLADFLVNGQLGMTSLALVPVAACRRGVIALSFGSEIFARGEELSFRRHGWAKCLLSILILTAVYLALYIWVDSAGLYPFLFCLLRFAFSLLVSVIVSLPVARLFLDE